jgi:hypothetical protein
MHAATSKVENSTQGSSCKLKFVHDAYILPSFPRNESMQPRGIPTPQSMQIKLFLANSLFFI